MVTGGSRGIGHAISLHLASLGAKILINHYSNSDEADFVASQINTTTTTTDSPRAITFQADVSDPAQVKSLFDAAKSAFHSQPHILGGSQSSEARPRGAFVCLTSSMAAALRPGYGAYAASKAAVEAMVKVLAQELKGTGITANCVAPGPIATEMLFAGKTEETVRMVVEECPLSRLGEPGDVAPVAGFLASDASEWVNGQVVRINGGYILFVNLLRKINEIQ
ncbi:NAD(P)-binding Rossmann-fold superfamily protein [Actinidia rufa]|uniref:NAD(P)-binding Rossmann-fold superfamily protein n=1 Tax=Actinidia rufa TaxID=165716 RepID=A0A7J0FMR5_9ERIC|nr:NAD(P)-binding Rossmann-fold superfamily protein [Actinidia rufa]